MAYLNYPEHAVCFQILGIYNPPQNEFCVLMPHIKDKTTILGIRYNHWKNSRNHLTLDEIIGSLQQQDLHT